MGHTSTLNHTPTFSTKDLPVKNTFIEYRLHSDSDLDARPRCETAPDFATRSRTNTIAKMIETEASDLKKLLDHKLGHCKPCAFVHRPEGCHNGEECAYCHLCPAGELKRRKMTKRRANRK